MRISPELHKRLVNVAMKNGDTLNTSVEKAIQEYVSEDHKTETHLQNTIKILAKALKTESKYEYDNRLQNWSPKVVPFHSNINMTYSEEMRN